MSARNKNLTLTDTPIPSGKPWRDGIYLVPTSAIDGRKRWQTIILLLANKVDNENIVDVLSGLGLP